MNRFERPNNHNEHDPDRNIAETAISHVEKVEAIDYLQATKEHRVLHDFWEKARQHLSEKPGVSNEAVNQIFGRGHYDVAAYHAIVVGKFSVNPDQELRQSESHIQQGWPRPPLGNHKVNVINLDSQYAVPRTLEPLALLSHPSFDVWGVCRREAETDVWQVESDALATTLGAGKYKVREATSIPHTPAAEADAFLWHSPPDEPPEGVTSEWRQDKVRMVVDWLKPGGKGAITCAPENWPYIVAAAVALDGNEEYQLEFHPSALGDASDLAKVPHPDEFDRATLLITRRKTAEDNPKPSQELEDVPFIDTPRQQPSLLGMSAAHFGMERREELLDIIRHHDEQERGRSRRSTFAA